MHTISHKQCVGLLRIAMGWLFLWPFMDKLWGLGFTTTKEAAWMNGGSPTSGFLTYGVKGPFAEFFMGLVGNPLVDWLFMLGLLGIGIGLIFGIFMRLAAYGGAVMLILMYAAASIPPEHNPFLDEHLIYALTLVCLAAQHSGDIYGFGKKWKEKKIVQMNPWMA